MKVSQTGASAQTFVKIVLILLALLASSSGRVELVAYASKEATTTALVALLASRLLVALVVLVVGAGEGGDGIVEFVHGGKSESDYGSDVSVYRWYQSSLKCSSGMKKKAIDDSVYEQVKYK